MPYQLLAEPARQTAVQIAMQAHELGINWRNSDWAHVCQSLGVSAPAGSPIVANLGGGVDSTAILIRMRQLGIRPDMIIFSWVGRDTSGDEWPETYRHMATLSAWCQENGFPAITIINYVHARGRYAGLYEAMIANSIFNSSNFGKHSCSAKMKGELIDRYVKRYYADHIDAGGRVIRLIGFEAEETERAERMNRMFQSTIPTGKPKPTSAPTVEPEPEPAEAQTPPCKRAGSFTVTNRTVEYWAWAFPMQSWGMTRAVAEALCLEVLGYIPVKSACYHCGFSKVPDFLTLARKHPYLASRLVDAECWVIAQGKLKIEGRGLLGKGAKGGQRRKARPNDGNPWVYDADLDRWISQPRTGLVTDLYRKHGLLESIEAARPTFLTSGVPDRSMTIHELDERADAARVALSV